MNPDTVSVVKYHELAGSTEANVLAASTKASNAEGIYCLAKGKGDIPGT
jgi:hypothetical protein